MRVGVVGAGFWAGFQIAAWREIEGVEIVGVADPDPARAARFDAPDYPDAETLLDRAMPDLVDVITPVESHAAIARLSLARGVPTVVQKPMATDLAEARHLVAAAGDTPFFVHENWRHQPPIRRVREMLDDGVAGDPFRGRIQFSCSFPVFENQPALREVPRFIVADVGSHLLDVARYLFGEVASVFATTSRVARIAGEDVATAMLRMRSGATVVVEMSYASRLLGEAFPQTFVTVEGERGCVELGRDGRIHSPTGEEAVQIPTRPWMDPAYALVQAAIEPTHRAILEDLAGGARSGLRAHENLRTVELVAAAYDAAARGEAIRMEDE